MSHDFFRQGYRSPCKNLLWFPMVKNASRSITLHLTQLNWQLESISTRNNTIFVVLRDPFERYVSGLVEDLLNNKKHNELSIIVNNCINNEDSWFLDFIFSKSIFHIGLHTELQTKTNLHLLPKDTTTFFKVDQNLNNNLHAWLLSKNIDNDFKFNINKLILFMFFEFNVYQFKNNWK
jgi:hypothetical protein